MTHETITENEVLGLPRTEVPQSDALQQRILRASRATAQLPGTTTPSKLKPWFFRYMSGVFSGVAMRRDLVVPGAVTGVILVAAVSMLLVFSLSPISRPLSGGQVAGDFLQRSQLDEDELIWQELLLMQDEVAFNTFSGIEFSEL